MARSLACIVALGLVGEGMCISTSFMSQPSVRSSRPHSVARSSSLASPPSPRVARLHNVARTAIHRGCYHEADRCYAKLLSIADPHPRSYLLKALHDVRMGRWEEARGTYRAGNRRYPADPQLLQGWGLLESRLGRMDVAARLLTRCIAVDEAHSPLQRWKMFGENLHRMRRTSGTRTVQLDSAPHIGRDCEPLAHQPTVA
mmetsp:Transcript_3532/g.9138  ORF Transcript_3532/g.9138 Transcript_3532/m.9138 type:complete len:201 (-) Transcript_3532:1720-2322(-)